MREASKNDDASSKQISDFMRSSGWGEMRQLGEEENIGQ